MVSECTVHTQILRQDHSGVKTDPLLISNSHSVDVYPTALINKTFFFFFCYKMGIAYMAVQTQVCVCTCCFSKALH